MSEFVAQSVESLQGELHPLPGIVACWETVVAGQTFQVNFEYSPELGVLDWWVMTIGGSDVMWLADRELSTALVEASLRFLAVGQPDLPLPVIDWAPKVEWGVGWDVELGYVEGMDGRELAAKTAESVGRPLVARNAPGPWMELK